MAVYDHRVRSGDPIDALITEAHETAVEKGWWEPDKVKTFGDLIALCHSELSEALEAFRWSDELAGLGFDPMTDMYGVDEGGDVSDFRPGLKPEGIPVELADVLIRIFDMCGWYGIDLSVALAAKMEYNRSRPRRHGGKTL